MTDLFSPLRLGRIEMPNRIVMAPLTRNRAGAGNVPHALNAEYYAQRASAGLIVSEATQISPTAQGYPMTPGIHSAEQVAGWKLVTDAVHAKGGRIVLQLWHVGRISHPSLLPGNVLPVAPSAIKPEGMAFTLEGMQPFVTPHALTLEEIGGVIEDYRKAAQNAMEAGFDGVEVHSANGYLLDQFLRDGSNRRDDQYGGSIPNRSRLLLEVVNVVCKVWGADRVGVRISPINPFNDMRDSHPQALFNHVAEVLNPFGLAYLHVMEGGIGGGEEMPAFNYQELRRAYKGLYMANSSYTKSSANQAIAEGRADCVAFGVPYIANPDLVERFAQDAPLNTADQNTFYGGDSHGYTDYPALGA
ncbi:N-ethylmaleimide reductase [Novimethylophilus kurashikiensis]|uniref:N-ethylmaleimide reductase n=1 Tax=Novimethylophilus kurashikiensis TaxID=1825523 RepID=A0A2R5FC24_9PROT|nr:alkene reductase [Novimethylophilus kurashikiensis]GBG15762.1 N-ethylmaleimide reductase [Novimethylophilus kurashikiensis]